MKVITLIENTTVCRELKAQHGLAFYIETGELKILFDCGANNLFLKNAEKLGIDIADVDYFILSHGHVDHGGGLKTFIKVNSKAKILVSKYAFNDYYFKVLSFKKYVGLNKAIEKNERIIFIDKEYRIDDNIIIFSDIANIKYCSSKSKLLKKENGEIKPDNFRHEQCLIIKDALFAGCSHTGIVNIFEKAKSIKDIKFIIGGFHLYNPVTKKCEDKTLIEQIANFFKKEDVKIYTGHCTGKKAYAVMESILKNKIEQISTGKELILNCR